MAVDDVLYSLSKPLESGQPWPRPLCPTCEKGFMGFSDPIEYQSEKSRSACEHWAAEPEWIEGQFIVAGVCENPECKQPAWMMGKYSVDIAKESWPDDQFEEFVSPAYSSYYEVQDVYPPLKLMPIPASAPQIVGGGIRRASKILFADPGLAATALRATIELFLTTEGISILDSDGKFRSAHARIKEWEEAEESRPQIADLFYAVKWLGNAGTHEDSDLTLVEVLDGARVLDEAFHRIFTGPDIQTKATYINSEKGPVRNRAQVPHPHHDR